MPSLPGSISLGGIAGIASGSGNSNGSSSKSDDPLALVMAPPPDETPDEQAERLTREAEARQISEAIDEQLKQERLQMKKNKVVKLLLLGQSESGECVSHHLSFSSLFLVFFRAFFFYSVFLRLRVASHRDFAF